MSRLPVVLVVVVVLARPVVAQERPAPSRGDSLRLLVTAAQPLRVDQPLVIGVAAVDPRDPVLTEAEVERRFGEVRALADSMGFGFSARPFVPRLHDYHHGALYEAPEGLSLGYIIMAPGHRPRLVRGLVSRERFREELAEYLRGVRPMAPS